MRKISALWACVVVLGACGGGGSGNVVPPATATAARAVATLAAPLGTTAAASTAAATTAPPATASAAATSTASPTLAAPASAAAASRAPAAATEATATSAPPTAPAATTAAATPAPTAAAVFSGIIHVTLTDTAIKLDRTSAPAGPVTFAITNSGYVPHELVVLQTSIPQDQLPLSTTDPKQVQEPGLVGQASNIAVGAGANLTLTLAAGPYVLICNIDNHYKDGMHTALTVTGS